MSVATEPPHVELDTSGNVLRARIASRSVAGRWYTLERSASGAWMHTDTACRGWCDRGACYHVRAMEEVMTDNEETRLITVQANPLALLDAVELEDIMDSKLIPSEKHIYSFQMNGGRVEGVSIDGVRDAARALSTKGEAIRELWVRLEREDERDAYFIACAARYAVAPDGREICMDTAIRAKRQPKYTKLRSGGEQFNESWYEIGVAKAVRNATEALLPEALKEWMKAKARERGAGNGEGARAVPPRADGACGECGAPAGKPHGTKCRSAGPIDAAPPQDERPAPEMAPPSVATRIEQRLAQFPADVRGKLIDGINLKYGGRALTPKGQTTFGKGALTAEQQAEVLAFLEKVTLEDEPEQLPFE